MLDQYLSVTQVAMLKGVSRNAVYKAVREGRLAAVTIVGVVAIKRADADKWQPRERVGRKAGKPMSEESKAKIAASQRARWQKRKAQ